VNSILEIGSWEGRSAVFFLNFFPRAQITCVDTFAGSPQNHPDDSVYLQHAAESEERFETNLSEFARRVEKVKSRSVPALDRLSEIDRRYDLIYIDGSHEGDDVMVDSLLSWRMLNVGGLLIWDDYRWKRDYYRPRSRIDAFRRLHKGELRVLHKGEQLISLRTSRPIS
jgi:predicted O-methyltransferase YrrM